LLQDCRVARERKYWSDLENVKGQWELSEELVSQKFDDSSREHVIQSMALLELREGPDEGGTSACLVE
jgi:hypothetical protein